MLFRSGVVVMAGSLYFLNLNAIKETSTIARSTAQTQLAQAVLASAKLTTSAEPIANPDQTAALMAQIELMRHGNCQLIEAIQLPDQYKGIYLNMVFNGQVSTDPREQKIAFALLKQTRCNYTPMLMANSK